MAGFQWDQTTKQDTVLVTSLDMFRATLTLGPNGARRVLNQGSHSRDEDDVFVTPAEQFVR